MLWRKGGRKRWLQITEVIYSMVRSRKISPRRWQLIWEENEVKEWLIRIPGGKIRSSGKSKPYLSKEGQSRRFHLGCATPTNSCDWCRAAEERSIREWKEIALSRKVMEKDMIQNWSLPLTAGISFSKSLTYLTFDFFICRMKRPLSLNGYEVYMK